MIMVIARVWDAINDPMFGAIAERTNTKKEDSSVYLLFHSVSGTCSSSDFYYHGRKRWCDLCSSYIYCVWNALYGSKFVIWFVVHGYDNQSGRYFSAYELENDGNKSQFSCSLGIVSSDYGEHCQGGESFTAKSYLLTIIYFMQLVLFRYSTFVLCKICKRK